MTLLQKIILILGISLIYNNGILAINRRTDKSAKALHSPPPTISVPKNDNNNNWIPIAYRTETDHNVEKNFEEAKVKDISEKSNQFFHDLTGTQSPYDKDMRILADRGLKLIKEQELEDKFKNLKTIETDNGAPLSLRIPNNNFNQPVPYGFVVPSNENEQNTEQAKHHHNYHQYHHHHHNPHQLHGDVNQYSSQNMNQGEYYQIPTKFAPHFEALTQARDMASKSNYHDPNEKQPHFQAPQPINYDVGIQHTFQAPAQHHSPVVQHYEENVNHFKPTNAPRHELHIQKHPSYPSESYNHQQLYFNDGNENAPRFEALTSNKPHHNIKKKKKHNHNQNSGVSFFSHERDCEKDECNEQKVHENTKTAKPQHKTRKQHNHHSHHKRHHHSHHNVENPNKSVLLNHKIYHDDDDTNSNSGSSEDSSNQHSYETNHSNKGKKLRKSKKSKRHHKNQSHPKQPNHSKEQYQISEHPNKGQSYQVIEYPQESRIVEKIVEPSNGSTVSDALKIKLSNQNFNKKLNNQHVDKDAKSKNQLAQHPFKNNKNKLRSNESLLKLTNTNDSRSKKNEFLINYRDENDQNDEDAKASASEAVENSAVLNKETRYFQDIYVAKKEPQYIELGHKLEQPGYLEERFQENNRKNQHFRGSVKWMNGKGEQGQQLWDLGHLG